MPNYNKPHLTVAQQVALLQSRGLAISSPADAERWLSVVGYYRLSGYWYPYRVISGTPPRRTNAFIGSATLDQVTQLYTFDRHLKLRTMDALERIEIAMRFRVGYTLGMRGAFAHRDPSNLDAKFTTAPPGKQSGYDKWLDRLLESQKRSSEDFVKHFRSNYNDQLPVWVATELLDFGGLSFLYAGMKRTDRDKIALQLGVVDPGGNGNGNILTKWMHVLNYLRNVCAHHSRLWNRNMAVNLAVSQLGGIPALTHLQTGTPAEQTTKVARPFGALCVVAYLLDQVSPGQSWSLGLAQLVKSELSTCGRTPAEMGFLQGWDTLPVFHTPAQP